MVRRCLGCMAEYESEYGICPYCGYEPGTSAESPLHMEPGTRLKDRYLVGKVLGYGGFGITYIAFDTLLNQRVAIKEYLPSEFATRMTGENRVSVFTGKKEEQFADGLVKFVDEARRLAKFQSEDGIVRVLDSFECNNTAYIVMEYLEGETLTAYLARKGLISPEDAVSLLKPVIQSLEVIHRAGIIHRDIAPDNIFLTTDGRVKLIDFGAARYATTSHSRSLTIIIKPGYSPEEQYRSRGEQGPHTDVYALAAVLYRMVTGVTPPDALERKAVLENKKKDILKQPSKCCHISSNLENAILNAMNVQVEDRTKTVEAFWDELTSTKPVRRHDNKIKGIDLARWPLWAKIVLPLAGAAAVALLVLLLTGIIGVVNPIDGDITLEEGTTRVPSVINYSVSAAQEMLETHHLAPVISGRQPSDVIPADLVLTQSISAGQVVDVNTRIELFISIAPEPQVEEGKAPDVMYFTEEAALTQFRALGIEPKVEYEYSDEVAAGLVMRQSIAGGSPIAAGDEVTLTVSLGHDEAQDKNENDKSAEEEAAPLSINRETLSLYVGDTVTLTASGGTGNYQWSSNNGSVASVEDGRVTAVGQGQAVITVTSGNETVTCPVTVREYSLSMSETQLFMTVGDTVTLSLSGAPSEASISWTSSDPGVATVSNGQIVAVDKGTAIISAQMTYGSKTYSTACTVTVTGYPEKNPEVKLSPESLNLEVGETYDLDVTVPVPAPGDNSSVALIWNSSDPSVATVERKGRIIAMAPGTTTISATLLYNGEIYNTATCVVTVSGQADVTVSSSSLSLLIGESADLTATAPDGQTVTWVSSDNSIATVSNGTVTARAAGKATITAKINYYGKTYADSCEVDIKSPSITINPSEYSHDILAWRYPSLIIDGRRSDLSAETFPEGQRITWSSSDTSVVRVGSSWRHPECADLNLIGVGTANVVASMDYMGKTYTAICKVTVLPPDLTPSITATSLSLNVGETYDLTYFLEYIPYGKAKMTTEWESSDPTVATVDDNGDVTAVGPGTAVITVTKTIDEFSESAQCTVTVQGTKQHTPETKTVPISLHIGSSDSVTATIHKGDTVNLSIQIDTAGESGYHLFTLWIAKLEDDWDQLNAYYVDGSLSTTYTLDTSNLEVGYHSFAAALFYSDRFVVGASLTDCLILLEVQP